ncbi:hypothetical protein T02_3683 [Trichinella nativa]|uniref:Uncharacterized protein n=1 Tax=Trichinella nativa TaxID=6335 RepID=A0A0V1LGK1_9BILA|nr:hypothetical protein T02_3683 [Trichinella nativa]
MNRRRRRNLPPLQQFHTTEKIRHLWGILRQFSRFRQTTTLQRHFIQISISNIRFLAWKFFFIFCPFHSPLSNTSSKWSVSQSVSRSVSWWSAAVDRPVDRENGSVRVAARWTLHNAELRLTGGVQLRAAIYVVVDVDQPTD